MRDIETLAHVSIFLVKITSLLQPLVWETTLIFQKNLLKIISCSELSDMMAIPLLMKSIRQHLLIAQGLMYSFIIKLPSLSNCFSAIADQYTHTSNYAKWAQAHAHSGLETRVIMSKLYTGVLAISSLQFLTVM